MTGKSYVGENCLALTSKKHLPEQRLINIIVNLVNHWHTNNNCNQLKFKMCLDSHQYRDTMGSRKM